MSGIIHCLLSSCQRVRGSIAEPRREVRTLGQPNPTTYTPPPNCLTEQNGNRFLCGTATQNYGLPSYDWVLKTSPVVDPISYFSFYPDERLTFVFETFPVHDQNQMMCSAQAEESRILSGIVIGFDELQDCSKFQISDSVSRKITQIFHRAGSELAGSDQLEFVMLIQKTLFVYCEGCLRVNIKDRIRVRVEPPHSKSIDGKFIVSIEWVKKTDQPVPDDKVLVSFIALNNLSDMKDRNLLDELKMVRSTKLPLQVN